MVSGFTPSTQGGNPPANPQHAYHEIKYSQQHQAVPAGDTHNSSIFFDDGTLYSPQVSQSDKSNPGQKEPSRFFHGAEPSDFVQVWPEHPAGNAHRRNGAQYAFRVVGHIVPAARQVKVSTNSPNFPVRPDTVSCPEGHKLNSTQ